MLQKKIKKELHLEERRFGVILEDIDFKLNLVVEGHQNLDQKIDRVDAKVDNLQKEMDYKFEVVFEKFGEITEELHIIRNDLKEKVGRDEFVFLEKRVAALEKARK